MKTFSGFVFVLLSTTYLYGSPEGSAVHITQKTETEYNKGSGTVVAFENGKSLILSCAHVCSDPNATHIVTYKGKEYPAKFLFGSKLSVKEVRPGEFEMSIDGPDLALLVVDKEFPVAEVGTEEVKVGDIVRQWGFSGGRVKNGPFFKQGKVTEAEAIWSTADSRRGDSGCGLFDKNDKLIGVVHSRPQDQDEPSGMALPLNKIRPFLKDNSKGFPLFQKSLEK